MHTPENHIRATALLLSVLIWMSAPAAAPAGDFYQSSNSKYQTMKVKHRAERNFTNNGKTLYHYVDDGDVTSPESGEIGNVRFQRCNTIVETDNGNLYVGSGSGVQSVHLAVALKHSYRFANSVRIGTISTLDPDAEIERASSVVKVTHGITVK